MKKYFQFAFLLLAINSYGQTRQFSTGPDYKKEISELTELIKKNPDSVNFYVKRALLVFTLNSNSPKQTLTTLKIKDVIPDIEKAIVIQPLNASLYEKLGEYKWQINADTIGAIQNLSKAIELEPSNPHWLNQRGGMYVRFGNYEMACTDFTKGAEMGDEKCINGKRIFCTNKKNGY
jgi:tetratricopeptide (TPR) repeat protein